MHEVEIDRSLVARVRGQGEDIVIVHSIIDLRTVCFRGGLRVI